jgi:hypothetical protein
MKSYEKIDDFLEDKSFKQWVLNGKPGSLPILPRLSCWDRLKLFFWNWMLLQKNGSPKDRRKHF